MVTDRKEEILDAFMKLVSRFGLDKTTLQDVAKEAGISVGVIYKDFKNKEDLIDAYIGRLEKEFVCSCERIITPKLPAEKLLCEFVIGVFRTISVYIIQDRGFLQCISGDEAMKYIRYRFKNPHPFMGEIKNITIRIMAQGVQEGIFEIDDIPKTATLFLTAFEAYGKMIFIGQEQDAVLSGVEEMLSFLIKALKKHPQITSGNA
jgi:AcrR family transcriptional regulator